MSNSTSSTGRHCDSGQVTLNATQAPRPIGLLSVAIPRLNRLTVAASTIHVVAFDSAREADVSHERLLDIIERCSAGALLRCHLALDADLAVAGSSHRDAVHAWQAFVYDATGVAITDLDRGSDPPPAQALAQDAIDWGRRGDRSQ